MALLRSVRHLRRSISTLSPNLRINVSSDGLVLSSQNTSSNLLTFPWLRDACQCSHCIHPSTRQKLFHTTEVDPNITPAKVEVDPDSNLVNVNWNDGHNSHFSYEFLQRNSNPSSLSTFNRDVAARPWSISSLVGESGQNLFNSYQDLTSSPSSLLAAIRQLCTYGILFVTDVPASETDDQNCELPKLANLFGEIRETFYGRVWDVRSVANSKNIAYTDLNLGLHMDLLYFQHPPRYQILHCLRSRNASGGTSSFSDGFRAASRIWEQSSAEFELLSSTPVGFHYINDGHHLYHQHTTIELAPNANSDTLPSISHVNYSPPFQSPLPSSIPKEFFPALRKFSSLLHEPKASLFHQLREGEAVIFDNRRVLHARDEFKVGKDGNRWLKGCYLEADAILDRGRILSAKLEG